MSNFLQQSNKTYLEDTFVPQVGILLPNGEFKPNTGQGHPKHAQSICQDLNIEVPNGCNADDFLIMSGCAMIATYDAFKKKQIKIAKNNPHYDKMMTVMNSYILHGFKVIEGWYLNTEYQYALEQALKMTHKTIIEETIIIQ